MGLTLAERVLGPIQGLRALVVGAGSMSALSAATLSRAGVTDIVIANRTFERAARLAQTVGGRAVELADVDHELAAADLVISCTGAGSVVIGVETVARVATGRPLFLLDLALPHDVDPGVTLVDLESIQEAGLGDPGEGGAEDVRAVRSIVAEEVGEYLRTERAAKVTPTVIALRAKAADVVEAELGRLVTRVPEIDGRLRGEIAQTVRRVVDKLLHEPTVRVKRFAASPAGDHYAEALRELFDLNPKVPDAVTRADAAEVETDMTGRAGEEDA